MPLGLSFGSFSECQVRLTEGSRLLLYSDGITEAENAHDEQYGSARLMKHMLQPEATMESIISEVQSHTNSAGLCDDATVIMVNARA